MRAATSDGGRPTQGSVDPEEAARFAALAAEWWDPHGKFRPLHKFNPVRIAYVRDRIAEHFGRDARSERPLAGLAVLDIGCGGGLLAEPLTRLGATVTGIDVVEPNIRIAALHAAEGGLAIDYRLTTAEALVSTGATFDAVLAMEVVEHVADVPLFLGACTGLVAPQGMMVVATLNRTLKSLLLAKVGAEYVLRWLPRGTHDWTRFLKPSEVAAALRQHGARITRLDGVVYAPFSDEWRLSTDIDVNYMALVVRQR